MAEPLLEVEDLGVTRGGRRVVEALSFAARAGQCLGLLGPNGAGKSSALKAVLGLLPHEGRVQTREPVLGYVPQRSLLEAAFEVRAVVQQGRFAVRGPFAPEAPADREAVERALGAADASDLADRAFTELSEGERRRVLIARALATESRVLLMDEPNSGLDLGHQLDLFALCRSVASEGRSVVVVLHDLEIAHAFMDQVVVLDRGATVAQGSPKDALSDDVLRAVWGVTRRNGTYERVRP